MTPSSSEVSSPSSPTFAFAPAKAKVTAGTGSGGSRVWSYLNQEFTPDVAEQTTSPMFQHYQPHTQTMFSSTTDYSSMQQSIQAQYAAAAETSSLEVEAILSRGKNRPNSVIGLSNNATTSPAGAGAAAAAATGAPILRQKKLPSPMAEMMRNSPTYRNSPRLDMELMDLAHLPPAPALKVQRPSAYQQTPYQPPPTQQQPTAYTPFSNNSQFSNNNQPGTDRNVK